MRIAHCVTKPTDTHSDHVILITCPLQQWLRYTSIAYLVITFMQFSSVFIHSWTSYALIHGLPLSKVKTVMFYGRTPSLTFFLYALLITVLTRTDLGHKHVPNSTVLQYKHCAANHARLHHGAGSENDFHLTITWNFIFCC